MQPVQQRMVDPDTDKEIPREAIQRGVEVESGAYVVLSEEERAALEPESSRDIEITSFVPDSKLPEPWYERPYFAGPDGDNPEYFALVKALESSELEGLAHWVMRKKHYNAALQSRNGCLILVTLRAAGEVLSAKDLPQPAGRAPDPREIQMARQLVSALEGEFKPEAFKDEYRDRLMKLIESKAKGTKPKLPSVKTRKEPSSLLTALQASLKKTQGGRAVA